MLGPSIEAWERPRIPFEVNHRRRDFHSWPRDHWHQHDSSKVLVFISQGLNNVHHKILWILVWALGLLYKVNMKLLGRGQHWLGSKHICYGETLSCQKLFNHTTYADVNCSSAPRTDFLVKAELLNFLCQFMRSTEVLDYLENIMCPFLWHLKEVWKIYLSDSQILVKTVLLFPCQFLVLGT